MDGVWQRTTGNHLAELLASPAIQKHAGHSQPLILERLSRQEELWLLSADRLKQVDARVPSNLMGDRCAVRPSLRSFWRRLLLDGRTVVVLSTGVLGTGLLMRSISRLRLSRVRIIANRFRPAGFLIVAGRYRWSIFVYRL
jgi:hypothetical protein